MFSIHDFIMTTLRGMIGQYPEFQIREYALNWYAKGKLGETDLSTIEVWFMPLPEISDDVLSISAGSPA